MTRTEQQVIQLLCQGAGLREVLGTLCLGIEEKLPGALCSLLVVGPDRRLHFGAGPSLPDDYNAAIDGLDMGPEVGSCGAAAWHARQVVVADIETHPNWAPYVDVVRPYGLRACWSTPVLAPQGHVLGTFAVYYREVCEPDERAQQVIAEAANLAAIAMLSRRTEAALALSEARYRALFDSSGDALLLAAADGAVLDANPAARTLFGWAPETLQRRRWQEIGDPADARWRGDLGTATGQARFEAFCQRADGSRFPAEVHLTHFTAGDGVRLTTAIVRDISERHTAQARLLHHQRGLHTLNAIMASGHHPLEERLRQALELAAGHLGMPYGRVCGGHRERGCRVLYSTPIPAGAVGPSQLCTQPPGAGLVLAIADLAHDAAGAGLPAELRRYIGAPLGDPDFGDGIRGAVEFFGTEPAPFDAESIEFMRLLARWLGSTLLQERDAATIRQLAHFDALTGLPNRSLFQSRLRTALGLAERERAGLALLFIDLDHFKQINDSLGHASGDSLLHETGRRLRACVRASDTVARLGGDEFVVLLEDIRDPADLDRIARHILETLAAPCVLDGHECQVSASIGISLYPEHGTDLDTLLNHADSAMYRVKCDGRNGFRYFARTA